MHKKCMGKREHKGLAFITIQNESQQTLSMKYKIQAAIVKDKIQNEHEHFLRVFRFISSALHFSEIRLLLSNCKIKQNPLKSDNILTIAVQYTSVFNVYFSQLMACCYCNMKKSECN